MKSQKLRISLKSKKHSITEKEFKKILAKGPKKIKAKDFFNRL